MSEKSKQSIKEDLFGRAQFDIEHALGMHARRLLISLVHTD